MKKILCRLFGHRWKLDDSTPLPLLTEKQLRRGHQVLTRAICHRCGKKISGVFEKKD